MIERSPLHRNIPVSVGGGNRVPTRTINAGYLDEQIALRSTRHFRMDEPEVSSSVRISSSRLDGTA